MTDFLDLSKNAFDSSSAFFDTNHREDIDYSLRAFRNEHAKGSKYLSSEFAARSRIFPPHTRTVIRKNEAAGMMAMFSNRELVNVTPGDPDDPMSVASAACLKHVLEYRLSKTIPAFQIYLGGLQDAQVQGAVVSYQYWEYQKKNDQVLKDKPCIELRPIENIRLDGGASWIDPVGTSPYFCDVIPMYVCDVRGMMASTDDKTGNPKWKKFDDATIAKASPETMDATRQARLGKSQDPHETPTGIKAFDVVWVLRWMMRDSLGDDYAYYTLGTEELLSVPKPLEEVYFHGKRPYVMGFSILETHRVFKTSMPALVRPLQQEAADIRNQRLDNVKFVLNKRWLVARGRQTDVQSLVRNVPGGVTLTADPNTDIKESSWPDVTSSSFVEEDRLKSNLDELAGNFSPSTKVANNAVNDTLGGSRMAAQGAGMMSEYLIRTVNETWWEPVLGQLGLLEQYYETDSVILGLCARKARLFPRFGLSAVTDELMMKSVNVTLDAELGDPQQRFQKFMMATGAAIQLANTAPPGANLEEMRKEIYANAGYRDGARFWNSQQDPRLMKAMQMIQQLQGALKGKQMELQAGLQDTQMKLLSNEKIKGAELQVDSGRISGDLQIRQSELVVEQQRLELERMKLELEKLKLQIEAATAQSEREVNNARIGPEVELAQLKLEQERTKLAGLVTKISGDLQETALKIQTMKDAHQNESRIGEVADQVDQVIQTITADIGTLKSGLMETRNSLNDIAQMKESVALLGQGFNAVAGAITRKKPTGFSLKKSDGRKTSAVVVSFDDGSEDTISVG